ncbi:hypothetical protein V8E51_004731 [Hyaloscypha variabilis]|jgi:hypothetical protein
MVFISIESDVFTCSLQYHEKEERKDPSSGGFSLEPEAGYYPTVEVSDGRVLWLDWYPDQIFSATSFSNTKLTAIIFGSLQPRPKMHYRAVLFVEEPPNGQAERVDCGLLRFLSLDDGGIWDYGYSDEFMAWARDNVKKRRIRLS